MPPIEITDDHRERIERLREELADRHAGPYATVGTEEVLGYLLDLADAVDDPDRSADADRLAGRGDGSNATGDGDGDRSPFDREAARAALEERNRRHGDPEDADRSDLYSIAAEFDVSGRSDMTKGELVEAILDAAAELAVDPFARVDVAVPDAADGSGDDETESAATDPADDESADDDGAGPEGAGDDTAGAADNEANDADGGAGQLNAMMSLLDTHDDKWRKGDGDARYEVELPDGSVETARTKDDVRALLFRNY
ncbi:Rho termination factor N-terminal domain-containing protein [Halorubrum cibi]|uniref:Rho termination factor, N-terminal domain n=1 Tax=Halorubrum cibi TaxID=413815 RepID=A0A521B887_9EURY|nr:Rho termination factor N-terminal domain-containing protein [Halorubrum cibi]SMO43289.1 Rho termination factor, N-terminal domain [Halorubrum cibi]